MSRTMVMYFLSVLVMVVPAALSMRRVSDGLAERLFGGVLLAVVWPLSAPALFFSVARGSRVRA